VTPRNHTNKTPFETAQTVVDAILHELRPPAQAWFETLTTQWSEIVGSAIATHTIPDSIENKELIVRVSNHLWQAELKGGLGRTILSKIQKNICKDIKQIRWVFDAKKNNDHGS
jgi:predicted nucleic acid-binding Zn ribbon protein